MEIKIRPYEENDLPRMIELWNGVVEEGEAFPQEGLLTAQTGSCFFATQTYSAVAVNADNGTVCGLYILHPNHIGRCGHICNASYVVSPECRGRHIGEKLVMDCIVQGRKHGFRLLQFNAVVSSNLPARHLYERLGFVPLGTIPGGFRKKDGQYEDICLYYYEL